MIIVVVTVNSSAFDLSSFGIVAGQMLADFVVAAAAADAAAIDIETVTAAATAAAVTVTEKAFCLLIPM